MNIAIEPYRHNGIHSVFKYVVGREGWKIMVVNRLMYGCGALVWYQHECDDLEIQQVGMGQWFWDVGNQLIRGETG